GTESRDDHDVLSSKVFDLCLGSGTEQVLNPQGGDLLVHKRVMDDFAENKETAFGKDLSGCVCEIDCSLNAVAKAELFCEPQRRVLNGQGASVRTDSLYNHASVVRLHLLLYPRHDVGRAEVDLSRLTSSRCGVGGHTSDFIDFCASRSL